MAESLRDAIAAAVKCRCRPGCRDVRKGESAESLAECAEAAAKAWIADWLRSDEARRTLIDNMAARAKADPANLFADEVWDKGTPWWTDCAIAALANALTKENPE